MLPDIQITTLQLGSYGQEVAENYASLRTVPKLKKQHQSMAVGKSPVCLNIHVSSPMLLKEIGLCLPDFAQCISLVEPQLLPELRGVWEIIFSLPVP